MLNKYKGLYRIYFDNKADFKEWLEYVQEKRKGKGYHFWKVDIEYWLDDYSKNGKNQYYFEDYKLDVCYGELEYAKSEGIEVVDFNKKEYVSWGNQVIRVYNLLND